MPDTVIKEKSSSNAISILAVILAATALIVAWLAYNRSGQDLETQVQNEVNKILNETGNETRQGIDEAEQMIDEGPDGIDDGTR